MGKELSIVRSLKLPEDYSCVDYIFYTKATYKTITATSADIFKVACEKKEVPAPPKLVMGGKPTIFILIGLVVCLLLAVIFITNEHRKIRIFIKSALQGKKFKKKKHYPTKEGKSELFCKKCGAQLKGKKRFCNKCGTKIT